MKIVSAQPFLKVRRITLNLSSKRSTALQSWRSGMEFFPLRTGQTGRSHLCFALCLRRWFWDVTLWIWECWRVCRCDSCHFLLQLIFFKGIICPVSTLASTAGSLPCRPSLPSQLVVLLLPFWQHRTLWHLWHPRHLRRHRSTVHSAEQLEIPMG